MPRAIGATGAAAKGSAEGCAGVATVDAWLVVGSVLTTVER
jgi:hypothetical protein